MTIEQQLLEANARVARLAKCLSERDGGTHDADCKAETFHDTSRCNCGHLHAIHVLNESPTQSLKLHDADVIEKMIEVLKELEYYRAAEALEFNVIQLRNSVNKEGE